MQMVMLLYRCILPAIFVLLTSCRTRKVEVNTLGDEESINVQVLKKSKANEYLTETFSTTKSNYDFALNQALNLTPIKDSSGKVQPVKYKELRNGKPYREIEIVGGTLIENAIKQEQNYRQSFSQERDRISNTLNKIDSLNNVMFNHFEKNKEVKTTGFQFGVYAIGGLLLLMAMLLAYVEYRIRQFKKYLNTR